MIKIRKKEDVFFILGFILIIAFLSFVVMNNPIDLHKRINYFNESQSNEINNKESKESQTPVQNESEEIGICDQTCIDFCKANPNTPGPTWDKITPPGSGKNCKTILEEELGMDDLSLCEECKCLCFFEENN